MSTTSSFRDIENKHDVHRSKDCMKKEYRSGAHSSCNLKHVVFKKIPIIFHNGANYDYPFIIKNNFLFRIKR